MKSVDVFFLSLRDAFRPSPNQLAPFIGVVGVFVSLGLGLTLVQRYRRRRDAAAGFARFVASRRLDPASAALIERLARRARVDPMLVVTHVDVFERATADELGRHEPSAESGKAGVFHLIGDARRALGFHELAEHFPLFTTRELRAGMPIEVAGVPVSLVEVNEACFAIEVSAGAEPPLAKVGAPSVVTLVHGQEARYAARCSLLARVTAPANRLVFAHDEHPARIQLRAAVRIPLTGSVELRRPASPSASAPASGRGNELVATGTLRDISVGGIALDTKVRIPVGSELGASFEIDGGACRDLAAWVLECVPRARGTFRLRLQFRDLPPVDETTLAAAVARRTARPLFRP